MLRIQFKVEWNLRLLVGGAGAGQGRGGMRQMAFDDMMVQR